MTTTYNGDFWRNSNTVATSFKKHATIIKIILHVPIVLSYWYISVVTIYVSIKLSRKTSTKKSVQRSRLYQPHNLSTEKNIIINWIGRVFFRIPFRVAIDPKSREFQFKVLHKHLATNELLQKISFAPSFLCT